MSHRRARRGAGGPVSNEVTVSKQLSFLLRHGAAKEGIQLDSQGYANLQDVLEWPKMKSQGTTLSLIHHVVATNDKQRFTMTTVPGRAAESDKAQDWLIRASQGHSITIEASSLLTPITLETSPFPNTAIHGTTIQAWLKIKASGGLRTMGRTHIHFASGLPPDEAGEQEQKVISGLRTNSAVLIYVSVRRSLEAGLKWGRSDNGVLLTDGEVLEQDEGGESSTADGQGSSRKEKKKQSTGQMKAELQDRASGSSAPRPGKSVGTLSMRFFEKVIERGEGGKVLWERTES